MVHALHPVEQHPRIVVVVALAVEFSQSSHFGVVQPALVRV